MAARTAASSHAPYNTAEACGDAAALAAPPLRAVPPAVSVRLLEPLDEMMCANAAQFLQQGIL